MYGVFGEADDFRLTMNGFNRETILPKLDFATLTVASQNYFYKNHRRDGWLGIAPYARGEMLKDINNFMFQLEHVQNVIDNSVVMLKVDLTKGDRSIVKFGGYDALMKNDSSNEEVNMMIFKTGTSTDENKWNLNANTIKLGDSTSIGENINIVFSPDRKFLYLPKEPLQKL